MIARAGQYWLALVIAFENQIDKSEKIGYPNTRIIERNGLHIHGVLGLELGREGLENGLGIPTSRTQQNIRIVALHTSLRKMTAVTPEQPEQGTPAPSLRLSRWTAAFYCFFRNTVRLTVGEVPERKRSTTTRLASPVHP